MEKTYQVNGAMENQKIKENRYINTADPFAIIGRKVFAESGALHSSNEKIMCKSKV